MHSRVHQDRDGCMHHLNRRLIGWLHLISDTYSLHFKIIVTTSVFFELFLEIQERIFFSHLLK
jgi:hypothetical protein